MLFWVVGPLWAQATAVSALYEAQVSVSNQGEAERTAAVKAALRQVLLKVVGNRPALSQISLDPLLEKAPTLVQQFRYQRVEEKEGEALTLWVRFDPSSVDQALRQQALPVWGKVRPTLLLWVAVEEGRNRYLLDASTASPAVGMLKMQAQVRGIPVIFPLWDLADQSQLAFTDIWGNFSDAIGAASDRYPAAAQLVGRVLHRQAGDWQARWTLYGMREMHNWTVYGELEQVLRAGVDAAADVIAARVAPITGNASSFPVQVNVSDVTSYGDYARLSSYFSNLNQIVAIQPAQLSRAGAEVRFTLELQGDLAGLTDSILLGRVLAPVEEEVAPEVGTLTQKLSYRLLP
jgi:uncharacterized protein